MLTGFVSGRLHLRALSRAAPLLLGLLLGCPPSGGQGPSPPSPPSPPPPPLPETAAAPSPLRRLTTEELNHTWRDLFSGIAVPAVAITEDPGRDFAQDAAHQPVTDLGVEELRAGANAVAATVAAAVHDDPGALWPRAPQNEDDAGIVVDEWLQVFLPRAFRRPVGEDERARFVDFFALHARDSGVDSALQLLLQGILQSPSHLYRLELEDTGSPDPRGRVPVSSVEMATRLSYFLWGTTPDDELLQAGIDDVLSTSEGLTAQARRLLDDPRSMDTLRSFHRQWLDLDRVLRTNKDSSRFPEYNEFMRGAMRREADRFLELVFSTDSSLRTLLTSRQTRLVPGLGPVYGVTVTEDDALVTLPPERSGILTQAQFLAARAHAVEGSPVLRGVFVLERLLCASPPPPSGNIDITPPSADEPGAATTNRGRYAAHTENPTCKSCHAPIDGIGFGLEGFDAIGKFRTTDGGQPVDTSGSLEATAVGGTFDGAAALGEILADSPVVADCVARHWFRFAQGRHEDLLADDEDLQQLKAEMVTSDGDIRALLASIVLTDAFRTRTVGGAP
jgi:hypothetical protein